MASQSLQAIRDVRARGQLPPPHINLSPSPEREPAKNAPMHRSSPVGYRRSACSPRKRGERGPFSNGL